MPEEQKEKTKKQERYEVVEVTTQTTPVIRDTHTEENFDMYIAICKALNSLEEIKDQIM